MTAAPAPHIPVLSEEVVHALAVAPGETYVDGTFGAGGYTKTILEKGAARVFASIAIPKRSSMAKAWPLRAGGA
jgi:16S rRNA (cytosine1402-N4)-methyltransferase